MRTLIGAVGHRCLRDRSAAIAIVERLQQEALTPSVVVGDVSGNPIALAQWLASDPAAVFECVIFVGAIEHQGRAPGGVHAYRWDGVLPAEPLVQQAVIDAVTGVISLDSTVVVAGHLGVLPPRVVIVEIEPREHAFGTELSPEVHEAVERSIGLVRGFATDPSQIDGLPRAALPAAATYTGEVR